MSEKPADRLSSLVAAWLPSQRWYAGKGRETLEVDVIQTTTVVAGEPGLLDVVVAARHPGRSDYYHLLLGLGSGHAPAGLLGELDGRPVFAATDDACLMSSLLGLVADGGVSNDRHSVGAVRFEPERGFRVPDGTSVRRIHAEQSNTSVVFGEQAILKLVRRPVPGAHPDVEVVRALHTAGCPHVPRLLGSFRTDLPGGPATLGIVHEFVPGATDGWQSATIEARAAADGVPDAAPRPALELGRAVARVHADLAVAFGTQVADAGRAASIVRQWHRRLADAVRAVPRLEPFVDAVRARYDEVGVTLPGQLLQRVHGDLHLGQTLHADGRWTLIDFEGEPGASLDARTSMQFPAQDLASMVRSYDYAAHQVLGPGSDEARCRRALSWANAARGAFLNGYAEVAGGEIATVELMSALELDKAIYEVAYEHAHRPQWISIPLGAVARILDGGNR